MLTVDEYYDDLDADYDPMYEMYEMDKEEVEMTMTEDGHKINVGDVLFNYYDMKWVRVLTPPDEEGWFSFQEMDSRNCLNGERVVKDPNFLGEWVKQALRNNNVSFTAPKDGLEV